MTAFRTFRFCWPGFSRRMIPRRGRGCDFALHGKLAVQGKAVDIGGYYHPDEVKATDAMRPSVTFNGVLG